MANKNHKPNQLRKGDITAISEAVNCSVKTVEFIIAGERGKRETELSKRVKEAINLRIKQNEELIEVCRPKDIDKVSPK